MVRFWGSGQMSSGSSTPVLHGSSPRPDAHPAKWDCYWLFQLCKSHPLSKSSRIVGRKREAKTLSSSMGGSFMRSKAGYEQDADARGQEVLFYHHRSSQPSIQKELWGQSGQYRVHDYCQTKPLKLKLKSSDFKTNPPEHTHWNQLKSRKRFAWNLCFSRWQQALALFQEIEDQTGEAQTMLLLAEADGICSPVPKVPSTILRMTYNECGRLLFWLTEALKDVELWVISPMYGCSQMLVMTCNITLCLYDKRLETAWRFEVALVFACLTVDLLGRFMQVLEMYDAQWESLKVI